MKERTYRYSNLEPLYPFGFGLSYTRFEYKDLKISADHFAAGEPLRISVELKNAGSMDASEVVQVYLSDLQASTQVPLNKLVGFKRVHLKAGQTAIVRFRLSAEAMMFVDENGEEKLEPGEFRLTVGGCSPSKRGSELGAPEPVSTIFSIE